MICCGGICFDARTELVPVYLENIVIEHVMPFGHACGTQYAVATKSPDLASIENVRDYLNRYIITAPKTLRISEGLENAVITGWNQIPQDFIQNLIISIST